MTEDAYPVRLFGRLLRFAAGLLLLYSVYPVVEAGYSPYLMSGLVTIALIFVFYTALHFAIANYLATINKWLGAMLAVTPVLIVFLFVDPAGGFAAEAYIGASLILTAVRGDGGCEVMAFPALLVGRFTHLVCIAFSPIDWVEEKIALRFQKA